MTTTTTPIVDTPIADLVTIINSFHTAGADITLETRTATTTYSEWSDVA